MFPAPLPPPSASSAADACQGARFRDVNPLSDQEAAQVMAGSVRSRIHTRGLTGNEGRRDELDVAVDLMGYTHGGRDGIFAHKPGWRWTPRLVLGCRKWNAVSAEFGDAKRGASARADRVQRLHEHLWRSLHRPSRLGHCECTLSPTPLSLQPIDSISPSFPLVHAHCGTQLTLDDEPSFGLNASRDICAVPVELTPFYSERQLLLDPCFVVFTHAANHPEVFSQGRASPVSYLNAPFRASQCSVPSIVPALFSLCVSLETFSTPPPLPLCIICVWRRGRPSPAENRCLGERETAHTHTHTHTQTRA
eukprot:3654317-Rhodomonas_salina.1